ncbi:MAG: DUF1616 domain-containing protein [Caldilineae bacterium]|nr:MAG: DUF1616 domain-containing protein [Caldilineae bacterium]
MTATPPDLLSQPVPAPPETEAPPAPKRPLPWRALAIAGGAVLALAAVIGLWLARGDWLYPTQLQASQVLRSERVLGQTFVARQAGLQGVQVKIHRADPPPPARLRLRLYAGSEEDALLREAIASSGGAADGAYVEFRFAPLPDSGRKDYYFTVQDASPGAATPVSLYGGPLEAYPDGAAYADGMPQDAQLAFVLNYDRRAMLWDFARRSAGGLPDAFAVLWMLFVPGAAVCVWLLPADDLDATEWLALSAGGSLALYPLALLFLRYAPLALDARLVWGGLLLPAVPLLAALWLRRDRLRARFLLSVKGWLSEPAFWAGVVVIGLSAGARWWVIDGLQIPLWADSYHHTLLVQLIVDNGRLVSSWEPYAPMQSVSYHTGFHAMVAVLHWLTGLPVPRSVLVFGQVLNTLAVGMAYLLGRRFGGSAWAGVFAALLTGLVSVYPAYYVNWGRYPQLAGQVLLPALMVATWCFLRAQRRVWLWGALTTLLAAGLFLTHYRVVLFYPPFIVALLFIRWYQAGWKRSVWLGDGVRLAAAAAGALALVSPRLLSLWESVLLSNNLQLAVQGGSNAYIREVYNALPNPFGFVPPLVVALAGLGLAFGAWQRRQGIFAVGVWGVLVFLEANPQLLRLPGAGLIVNFTIFIGAYMVFSTLAGFALAEPVRALTRFRPALGWLLVPAVAVFALGGAARQMQILNPAARLVTRPDLRAMAWIAARTPPDARFLVNSRSAYGGSGIAGTDAGWWLPYLAGRENTAPPLIYPSEKPPYPAYVQDVYETYRDFWAADVSDAEFARRMAAHGLDYIYIGQQRGRVWQGEESPLDWRRFADSPYFEPVYARDGVRVFRRKEP